MRLIFDHRMFRHINDAARAERGEASKLMVLAERLLRKKALTVPISLFEQLASLVLNLPIPFYRGLIYAWVSSSRGLPHFFGMYLRALYYRRRLGRMEPNVFIDQGVFFAYPKGVYLSEFSFIDKNVIVMSKTAKVGRRVHIAPSVFVSGGGHFEIEDYACIATGSKIITSTEVLKDGARCSGPMVSADQRNVLRGSVRIEKDAFVGANVTILPNVTMKRGSVAGAGVTLARDTEEWGIYALGLAQKIGDRDPVNHEYN